MIPLIYHPMLHQSRLAPCTIFLKGLQRFLPENLILGVVPALFLSPVRSSR